MPAWILVSERLPRVDMPTMLWGTLLDGEVDFPVYGSLCGHCGQFIGTDPEEDEDDDPDHNVSYIRSMVGTVTHWLEWEPAP